MRLAVFSVRTRAFPILLADFAIVVDDRVAGCCGGVKLAKLPSSPQVYDPKLERRQ